LGTFYYIQKSGDIMGAALIELISSIVNITGNPIADTIIFAIIGVISGSIAFGVVGMLFDAIGKYDSKSMSDVHWGVRVFIFVLLTYIFVKVAQFFRWLFTPPALYYFIAAVVFIIIIVVILIIFKSKKHNSMIESTSKLQPQLPIKEVEKPIEIVDMTEKHNPNICPFCGGQLVKRKGPYGRFLGCTNFPVCKYTRKQD
jgi:hypothetical protein